MVFVFGVCDWLGYWQLVLMNFLLDSHEGTAFGSFRVWSVSRQTVRFISVQSFT